MTLHLSRRTVLRGLGASISLPLLEIMCDARSGRAASDSGQPPVRTAFFYIPNGVVQSAWNPVETGANFELTPTLKPLEPVRNKILMLSNLDRIKVAGTDGHAQASTCYLSTASPDEHELPELIARIERHEQDESALWIDTLTTDLGGSE